jgi:mycofactocin system glycosyltransferase
MRYRLDRSVRRVPGGVLGGSPLRLFRLTEAGERWLDRLAAGEPVATSGLLDRLLDSGTVHPVPPVGSGPSPADVTVVVPAHGRLPHRADDGARWVVVDDASDPPLPGAEVRLEVNRGPAGARSAGLAEVTTPLVAFVDTDVAVPPDWLAGLLPHFADPTVALVAPRVRSTTGPGLLARYERRRSPLDLGPEPAPVQPGTRVGYVPAAALLCRVEALEAVGGFDPSLRYGEDVDLVWRLVAAGWRGRYDPAVEVLHEPRPTWGAWFAQRRGYGSSAAPLDRRHPGAVAPARADPWSAAAWAAVAVGHPALGLATLAAAAGALARRLARTGALPATTAAGLAVRGTALAGPAFATAVRRAWWPILAMAALGSRRARRVLLASLLAAGDPIRVADDLAYSVGVWQGCWRERRWQALVPHYRRRP